MLERYLPLFIEVLVNSRFLILWRRKLKCHGRPVFFTPLINLARVNQFDLLAAFYDQIVIPEPVYAEVVVRGEGRDGSQEVKEATWIDVQVPRDELAVRALAAELGMGEASAIILAQELDASLLILDEIRGRRIALQLGLKVHGTLGILTRAK